MTFQDKTLTCMDCGSEFTFTTGEQEFYQSKELLHEPRRCPQCRLERRRGGSQGFGGRARELFKVICASCGVETEVPFQPREDRPVYCSNCFSKTRTGTSTDSKLKPSVANPRSTLLNQPCKSFVRWSTRGTSP